MKIAIVGSMYFAEEMLTIKDELEKLGHEVQVPHETEQSIDNPQIVHDSEESLRWVIENDAMRKGFDHVAWSDGVLVLNYEKKGIKGYVGVSSIMEMGVGFYLRKKLYLLREIPHWDEQRWAHEIEMMQPTILNDDLTKLI